MVSFFSPVPSSWWLGLDFVPQNWVKWIYHSLNRNPDWQKKKEEQEEQEKDKGSYYHSSD